MKQFAKRIVGWMLSVFMLVSMLPTVVLPTTVTAAEMPIPSDDNFTILWTTDPQWYSFAYPEVIEHQNDWVIENYAKLDMRYIVHTGDFVDNPNSTEQWSIMDAQYKKWDDAGLAYGILAGNHDVSGSDHSNFSKYFGEARYNSKPWYGGSYEDNFGHYDLMTIDGIKFIFVYMGFNSTYKQADYDWLNSVLAAHPDRIAFLGFHEYLAATGERTGNGELFFQNVVLKNPNVRMVMCGHNYNSTRKVEEIDDNGDGKADRTLYQIMANYQSTTKGGNGFMRFMEFSPKNGTITARTYSPYIGEFGSDYEDGTVIDGYGYRDEFVIPFDFSAPSVRANGEKGNVVVTPSVSFGVTDTAAAVTLPLGYQNTVENGTSFKTVGAYNRQFSFNAIDAYPASYRSLNYVVATYTPGSGYAITRVTKGSSLSATYPFVPIPQNSVVLALTSDAVDVNTLTIGRKVFLKAPALQTPTTYKSVTLWADELGNSLNIDGINRANGDDEWIIYDDETKNGNAHVWNMLFAFSPMSGTTDRYVITAVNTTGGVAKMLKIPEGGFVLSVNTYSATDTLRDAINKHFKVGFEAVLVGHEPGKPAAYSSHSILPPSAAGWDYDSTLVAAVDENGAQAISKVSGSWPEADYDLATPITFDPSSNAFYYDYMLETDGKNNIMLFFKNSNSTSYVSGEYISIQSYFSGANISTGSGDVKGDGVHRTGKVDFKNITIPDTCYNADGTLTLNGIRILSSGTAGKKLYLYDMGITSELTTADASLSLMDPDTLSISNKALAGNYVYDSGKLTVEAMTDSGFQVEFALNKKMHVATLKNWLIDMSSTAPFDVKLEVTTSGADAVYGLVSEFRPGLCTETVNDCLPAGDYNKSLDLLSCYTWNNVLPADGMTTVKKVTIVLGGKGKLNVNVLQLASGTTAGTFADGVYKVDGSGTVFETSYTVQNGMVSDVAVDTSVSAFLAQVTSDYTVTVYENGVAVSGDTLMKTEQTVEVTANGTTLVSFVIVVAGDVDKNGQSSTSDARLLLGYALGVNKNLSDAQMAAGDLNGDGGISTTDARVILQGIVM